MHGGLPAHPGRGSVVSGPAASQREASLGPPRQGWGDPSETGNSLTFFISSRSTSAPFCVVVDLSVEIWPGRWSSVVQRSRQQRAWPRAKVTAPGLRMPRAAFPDGGTERMGACALFPLEQGSGVPFSPQLWALPGPGVKGSAIPRAGAGVAGWGWRGSCQQRMRCDPRQTTNA